MDDNPGWTFTQLWRAGAKIGVSKSTCGVQHAEWTQHQLTNNTEHVAAIQERLSKGTGGGSTLTYKAKQLFDQHDPKSWPEAKRILRENGLSERNNTPYRIWNNGGTAPPQRQYPPEGLPRRIAWDICDQMIGHRQKDIFAAMTAAGINPGSCTGHWSIWRRYYGYTRDNPPDPATHVVKLVRED